MIYKRIISVLFLFFAVGLPSFAEKIPVKIAPIQVISTHHDAVEVGDWVKFAAVNDVYLNDKLYIKANTEIIGIVDFVHQNGWGGDSAEVCFKNFYMVDVNNKKITISYPLIINGHVEMATNAREVISSVGLIQHLMYFPFIFRGAEVLVEPDTKTYNLFIEL